MLRYFKKYDTRVAVRTGQGFAIPFESITDEDGGLFEWGVLATQDGYVISELENLIRQSAGGVAEISPAEYEALKKKEIQTLLPSWREGVYPKQWLRILHDAARDAAAAAKPAVSLPAVVRGMQTEFQRLSRPMGVVSGWKPAAVAR